jgi:CelD/BcsL family acetyltransferase involved in cellulose biosynthesis
MVCITLSRPSDLAELADRWQSLEAQAELSFFQSWTWVGCLAEERFSDPVLLTAEADGMPVALAMFNRRRRLLSRPSLHLGESGCGELDSVFVEHNGPVLRRGFETLLPDLLAATLRGMGSARWYGGWRLVLSGVGDGMLQAVAAAGGAVRRLQTRPAPLVDLAALRLAGRSFMDGLSANTRYQLRRSARSYAAAGPVEVRRAGSVEEAWEMLDGLAVLHQASWTRRGRPGAFARPAFRRFHRALLARALPRGEADMLCIAAGSRVIGYLYNFRFRNRVLAYQSGFDYAAAGPHQKPGLTCHHAAIEACAAEGIDCYDFLAGAHRYKSSLANEAVPLHWLVAVPRWPMSCWPVPCGSVSCGPAGRSGLPASARILRCSHG